MFESATKVTGKVMDKGMCSSNNNNFRKTNLRDALTRTEFLNHTNLVYPSSNYVRRK